MTRTAGLAASAFDAQFAAVAQLPPALFAPTVTHGHGELLPRVEAVLAWREALLDGCLPDVEGLAWPAPALARAARDALAALGLPQFCRGHEELADAVVLSLLEGLAGVAREMSAALARVLARREAGPGEAGPEGTPGPEEREALRLAAVAVGGHLSAAWSDRVAVWAEVARVFGDLGALLEPGWDLTRGLLKTHGWQEIARLRRLLEDLPALREVIRVLGRLRDTDEDDDASVSETLFEPVTRLVEELREVRAPHVPEDTRGVHRSADLDRMLPSEAALLTRPRLRLLWHARRAERALLTYRVEGTDLERFTWEEHDQRPLPRPRRERGPIVVCLDTSGSMAGTPETVAKALTLEALRTAHREGRACYVYAFSGPGDVAEHELDLTPAGLGRLVAFLAASFRGGTDVDGPFDRALARVATDAWSRADILLVSDGLFPVPPALADRVATAREDLGLRVHGVLIGHAPREPMAALCDPVHAFGDWGALACGGAAPAARGRRGSLVDGHAGTRYSDLVQRG